MKGFAVPFPLEPEARSSIQLIAEHRPRSFKRFMEIVPAGWWVTAVKRGRIYRTYEDASRQFAEHYHRVCGTMQFTHDWFSNKLCSWHDFMSPYVHAPVRILEVGVFQGRSVVFCLEYAKHSQVVAIDNFLLEAETESIFDNNVARYGDRVRKIAHPSWSGLTQLIYERQSFDMIYVDAAHNSPDVLADSLLAWRLLKPGGLFVWDDFMLDVWDIGPGTVTEGVCRFLDMFKGGYEWVHAGWQVVVRKTSGVPPYE